MTAERRSLWNNENIVYHQLQFKVNMETIVSILGKINMYLEYSNRLQKRKKKFYTNAIENIRKDRARRIISVTMVQNKPN